MLIQLTVSPYTTAYINSKRINNINGQFYIFRIKVSSKKNFKALPEAKARALSKGKRK